MDNQIGSSWPYAYRLTGTGSLSNGSISSENLTEPTNKSPPKNVPAISSSGNNYLNGFVPPSTLSYDMLAPAILHHAAGARSRYNHSLSHSEERHQFHPAYSQTEATQSLQMGDNMNKTQDIVDAGLSRIHNNHHLLETKSPSCGIPVNPFINQSTNSSSSHSHLNSNAQVVAQWPCGSSWHQSSQYGVNSINQNSSIVGCAESNNTPRPKSRSSSNLHPVETVNISASTSLNSENEQHLYQNWTGSRLYHINNPFSAAGLHLKQSSPIVNESAKTLEQPESSSVRPSAIALPIRKPTIHHEQRNSDAIVIPRRQGPLYSEQGSPCAAYPVHNPHNEQLNESVDCSLPNPLVTQSGDLPNRANGITLNPNVVYAPVIAKAGQYWSSIQSDSDLASCSNRPHVTNQNHVEPPKGSPLKRKLSKGNSDHKGSIDHQWGGSHPILNVPNKKQFDGPVTYHFTQCDRSLSDSTIGTLSYQVRQEVVEQPKVIVPNIEDELGFLSTSKIEEQSNECGYLERSRQRSNERVTSKAPNLGANHGDSTPSMLLEKKFNLPSGGSAGFMGSFLKFLEGDTETFTPPSRRSANRLTQNFQKPYKSTEEPSNKSMYRGNLDVNIKRKTMQFEDGAAIVQYQEERIEGVASQVLGHLSDLNEMQHPLHEPHPQMSVRDLYSRQDGQIINNGGGNYDYRPRW